MVQKTIKQTLKDFGLTDKELEIYLFLTKAGVKKTSQIVKQLKTNKGLIYRLLKNLQKKGVVEATLESPTRYTAVPLEKVIDFYIKSKREEASRIEEEKNSLLSEWNRISQQVIDSSLEKFGVIEGKKKIHQKILQMFNESEKQVKIALLVSDLLDLERFGIFDKPEYIQDSKKDYRILTQMSESNLKPLQILKKEWKSNLVFKVTNPSLGLLSFSRMVIKDNDEVVLFISDNKSESSSKETDVCLFTNCKSIIQAFSGVFEELWTDSIKIEDAINQMESGKPFSQMVLIKDSQTAKQKFEDVLKDSENEVLIVSSSEGLALFQDWLTPFDKNYDKRISVKIMVPIIENNLEIAQNLLKFSEVKHIDSSYIDTVIIDSTNLFQFKHPKITSPIDVLQFFENTLYTTDIEYIEKTKNMFKDLWTKALVPSEFKIESIFTTNENPFERVDSPFTALKNFRRVVTFNIKTKDRENKLTEKDILDKILKAKTIPEELQRKDTVKFYASTGQAIIHPPKKFNLPDIMLHAFHVDEQSTEGGGDSLVIFLWLETPSGLGFVPVAIIGNNPSQKVLKKVFKGTPAGNNLHILSQDKFSVRIHGNNLFAVWTEEIPLVPKEYKLPPACFSLEGFGEIKTGNLSVVYQSGFKNWMEFNALEARVIFFHPASKYSGPGTDGILFRDYIGEHYIPK